MIKFDILPVNLIESQLNWAHKVFSEANEFLCTINYVWNSRDKEKCSSATMFNNARRNEKLIYTARGSVIQK